MGVDPNPEMSSYAMQAAHEANLPREAFHLLDGTAEQLPVPSTSQDAVVCTLVSDVMLCNVIYSQAHPPTHAHAALTCECIASSTHKKTILQCQRASLPTI